jgi:hypothetical protein
MDSVIDERQPLLGNTIAQTQEIEHNQHDHLVEFDPNGDPENPLEWPVAFKWGIVALLALMAFTV